MLEWRHGGDFSLDAAVRLEADDREGLEQLLRYCARPWRWGTCSGGMSDTSGWSTACPQRGADDSPELVLTALELLERLSAFTPPPRIHRHRYYGVLAPNALLRPAVTALASQQAAADPAAPSSPISETQGATSSPSPSEEKPRRPSVYLWAMLLARIYEVFPLVCHRCGGEVEIISFITEARHPHPHRRAGPSATDLAEPRATCLGAV